jgi:polyhydroxyalkanoate synthesis repressor PhaR
MHVAETTPKTAHPVVIRKYANRRLYNTQTSSYVTLDHLSEMVKNGTDFEVRDARSNEDITRAVLLQIITEEESKGQNLLSIRFLRRLIRFYGDNMQVFVPGYLDLTIDSLVRNRDAMRERLTEALGGNYVALESENRQNRALLERAADMLQTPAEADIRHPTVIREQSARSAEEISKLKDELEEMRKLIATLNTRADA